MRWFLRSAFVAVVGFAVAPPAQAAPIVVPGSNAGVEANSNLGVPFNLTFFGLSSERYQQVYASSAFPSGTFLVTQIAFRPDAEFGAAFSSVQPSVQINLSTTAAAPDALSTTFANNVGANDAVVFSGPLSLSSAFTGPAAGPKAFDIVINLATPFVYNTASGNLLLDVRNFGGGSATQLDAQDAAGDAVSTVYTFTGNANEVNSPTANVTRSIGLVTRFNLEPVPVAPIPEPTTLAVLGLMGVAGAGAVRRRLKGAAIAG